jgi:hypothetical protein
MSETRGVDKNWFHTLKRPIFNILDAFHANSRFSRCLKQSSIRRPNTQWSPWLCKMYQNIGEDQNPCLLGDHYPNSSIGHNLVSCFDGLYSRVPSIPLSNILKMFGVVTRWLMLHMLSLPWLDFYGR